MGRTYKRGEQKQCQKAGCNNRALRSEKYCIFCFNSRNPGSINKISIADRMEYAVLPARGQA